MYESLVAETTVRYSCMRLHVMWTINCSTLTQCINSKENKWSSVLLSQCLRSPESLSLETPFLLAKVAWSCSSGGKVFSPMASLAFALINGASAPIPTSVTLRFRNPRLQLRRLSIWILLCQKATVTSSTCGWDSQAVKNHSNIHFFVWSWAKAGRKDSNFAIWWHYCDQQEYWFSSLLSIVRLVSDCVTESRLNSSFLPSNPQASLIATLAYCGTRAPHLPASLCDSARWMWPNA